MKGHNYAGVADNLPCRKCGELHIHNRPRQGAHLSEESRKRISEKNKEKHFSPDTEFKKGQLPWNTGKHLSKEHKRKISETLKKKGISPKQIEALLNYVKTHEPWNKDKKLSEEHIKKLSLSHIGIFPSDETRKRLSDAHRGENHWNWQGGISDRGYSDEWGKRLRKMIRRRDNNSCQICGILGKKKLDVHHIDFNKTNNELENLISLCHSCHMHVHNSGRGSFQT